MHPDESLKRRAFNHLGHAIAMIQNAVLTLALPFTIVCSVEARAQDTTVITAQKSASASAADDHVSSGKAIESLSPPMRVATINHRLATQNTFLCARTAPITGLLLHDLGAYDEKARPAISNHYGIHDGFGVLGVVSGSASSMAGLEVGDEIVGVDALAVSAMDLPAAKSKAAYDRIEAFNAILTARLLHGPISLSILREGKSHSKILEPKLGCDAPAIMAPEIKPNAWSDAHYAVVTEGLVRVADDDELAFALAHEMAHLVLDHAQEPHGPLIGLGIGGKRSRDRERAADHLGVTMVLTAGYHERGTKVFLSRLAKNNGPSISLTHPSLTARLAAIHETAATFQMQR